MFAAFPIASLRKVFVPYHRRSTPYKVSYLCPSGSFPRLNEWNSLSGCFTLVTNVRLHYFYEAVHKWPFT